MRSSSLYLVAPYNKLLSLMLLVLIVFVPSLGLGQRVTVLEKQDITKDTIWQGHILLKGDVRVVPGVTLIIMPGTTVSFERIEDFGPEKLSLDKSNHFPKAELIVRGRLIAQGTPERPIVFTSAEKAPALADWGAVNFIGSRDNLLEYCEFSYGHTPVHCHSAQVVVSHCSFHDNGVAIGLKNVKGISIKSAMTVLYCKVWRNGGGILIGGGTRPVISHNDIEGNKFFGIFTKKSGPCTIRFNNIEKNGKGVILYGIKGLILRDNNIANNLDYNISLLEGQKWDIVAPHNWWGESDPAKIQKHFHDHQWDKSLGKVVFTDFATGPIPGAGLLKVE